MKKLKQALSLTLTLVLFLSLAVPAFAAEEQRIVANGEVYDKLLAALMSEPEDKPLTVTLESDVDLTGGVAIVIGSSDYGGLFGGQTMTIASHDITIDLNGHTLTGNEGVSAFKVQDGYQLKIIDSSENQTGEVISQGEEAVQVEEGGSYQPAAPAGPGSYTAKKGDTWSGICTNFYGDNAQRYALMKANKGVKLKEGAVVTLPEKLGKTARIPAPVAGEGEKLYTVQLGDTLGKIAASQYGKVGGYKAIFERNQDRLKNANTIYEGQVIVLPAIEK